MATSKPEKKKQQRDPAVVNALKAINSVTRPKKEGKQAKSAEEKAASRKARQDRAVEKLTTLKKVTSKEKAASGEKGAIVSMSRGDIVTTVFTAVRAGLAPSEIVKRTGGAFLKVTNWSLAREGIIAIGSTQKRPKDADARAVITNAVLETFGLETVKSPKAPKTSSKKSAKAA